jgi:hypothetical protein
MLKVMVKQHINNIIREKIISRTSNQSFHKLILLAQSYDKYLFKRILHLDDSSILTSFTITI